MGDKSRHLGKRHVCRHMRREVRRIRAAERSEARTRRSNTEQLRLLDSRPGSSMRERAKLSEA